MLGAPKRRSSRSSGFSRGPGSHSTIASRTQVVEDRDRKHTASAEAQTADEQPRCRVAVGDRSAGPVADREAGENDADQRAPDEERIAEERREHAARRDFHPEDHCAGNEHGAGQRKAVPPNRHGDPLYSSYTATQGPASLPVAAW